MCEDIICKKISALLSLYIDNKLEPSQIKFIENHFRECSDCYQKYLEMKEIIGNLRYSYQQMLCEFEKIETIRNLNIKEYQKFYNNISPYIDNELDNESSIMFRKYLINSKHARKELANAYILQNQIKRSMDNYISDLKINYSNKIISDLKKEKETNLFYETGKKIALFFLILLVSSFMAFFYYNHQRTINIYANNGIETVKPLTATELKRNEIISLSKLLLF